MFIHVVKSGESLFSIAKMYGGTTETIRAANELYDDRIIPGMSLIIPAGPPTTLRPYIIQAEDSLDDIAKHAGIPPHIIRASNEKMNKQLIPGETIWLPSPIQFEKTVDVNAFLIPTGNYTDEEILSDTADCLTYVSIFHACLNRDGTVTEIPDERILEKAKLEQVAPLLTITNFNGREFSPELARFVLKNSFIRQTVIANLLILIKAKGYRGINVDFEHLYPEDRHAFTRFIGELAKAADSERIELVLSLAPKSSDDPGNPLMGAFDYRTLGQLVNQVALMTFEWGWSGGPPMAIAPLNRVREVLEYAASVISPQKISMGMALYGYSWPILFEANHPEGNHPNQSDRAAGISPSAAVRQAIDAKGHIHFHKESASPMFTYRSAHGEMRQVWFEDARSVLAKFHLVQEMGLRGISYWMLGHPFQQNWTLLHSTFRIRKLNST